MKRILPIVLFLLLFVVVSSAHAGDDCPFGYAPSGGGSSAPVKDNPDTILTWKNGDMYVYEFNDRDRLVLNRVVKWQPPNTVCQTLAEQGMSCADSGGGNDGTSGVSGGSSYGGDGGGVVGSSPCVETIGDPTTSVSMNPPYPLPQGQGGGAVSVLITVFSGMITGCGDDRPDLITNVTMDCILLSGSSVAWITGELAAQYPGARVLGSYPMCRPVSTTGAPAASVNVAFNFTPLDPGYYDHPIHVTTESGKRLDFMLRCPVRLLDTTIIK